MKTTVLTVILFMGLNAAAAYRQAEVSGVDGQVLMDAFKMLGRTTSYSDPLSGAILGLAFAYESGGFTLECRVSNPGIVSRGGCKLRVNAEKSTQGVSIVQEERASVVTFADEETVRRIEENLPESPFSSSALSTDGTPLVKLECGKVPEHKCQLRVAN